MLPLPLLPVLTILLVTAGVGLICVEFNRPGTILPGAAGLLALLIGVASMARGPHPLPALGGVLACAAAILLDARRPRAWAAALALPAAGLAFLSLAGGMGTRLVAVCCACAIAAATHRLNLIAHRARLNKARVTTSKGLD